MNDLKIMKKQKNIKKANSFVFFLLKLFIRPALYLLYRFKFDMKTSQGIRRPCIILSNHQTVFDQFAVSMGFNFGINFVGSDTLFRYGLKSKIMTALARPIPFSKGTSDFAAIKNIISVIKDGGCVGMFPSGNRSFYGEESTIVPGIGKLVKILKAPLALVQLL
jgi:1-acyl-sn-glycerol-3-phosphate acyltransferase